MSDPVESAIRALVQALRDELAAARPANDATEWLTVALYAHRWNISQSTVREAIRTGRLAHERVGRVVRIVSTARITATVTDDAAQRADLILMRGGKVR